MGFGSGGGSASIASSSDVALNNPANLDVLTYDTSTSKWKNALASAGVVSSVAGRTGAVVLAKADVQLGNVDNTTDADKPVSTLTQSALDGKVGTSDSRLTDTRTPTDGTVTTAKVVDGAITTVKINDTAVTSAKLSSAVQTSLGKADSALQTAPVTSVASKTGAVSLVKGDVGLGSVDNTADTAKPISTFTQTALNGKADTAHTHAAADIASGTINTARLPAATDTTVGVVELATPAEVVTGTDTVRGVTPAGVKAAINTAIPTVVFVNTLGDIPLGTPVDTLVVVRSA